MKIKIYSTNYLHTRTTYYVMYICSHESEIRKNVKERLEGENVFFQRYVSLEFLRMLWLDSRSTHSPFFRYDSPRETSKVHWKERLNATEREGWNERKAGNCSGKKVLTIGAEVTGCYTVCRAKGALAAHVQPPCMESILHKIFRDSQKAEAGDRPNALHYMVFLQITGQWSISIRMIF